MFGWRINWIIQSKCSPTMSSVEKSKNFQNIADKNIRCIVSPAQALLMLHLNMELAELPVLTEQQQKVIEIPQKRYFEFCKDIFGPFLGDISELLQSTCGETRSSLSWAQNFLKSSTNQLKQQLEQFIHQRLEQLKSFTEVCYYLHWSNQYSEFNIYHT